MIEKRHKVGKRLAETFGLTPESLRQGLLASGAQLERPGRRGTFVAEGELQRFIEWSRRRGGGAA